MATNKPKAPASAPASAGASAGEAAKTTTTAASAADSSAAPAPALVVERPSGPTENAGQVTTPISAEELHALALGAADLAAKTAEAMDAKAAERGWPRTVRVLNNSAHVITCRQSGFCISAGGSASKELADEDHAEQVLTALRETVERMGIDPEQLAVTTA